MYKDGRHYPLNERHWHLFRTIHKAFMRGDKDINAKKIYPLTDYGSWAGFREGLARLHHEGKIKIEIEGTSNQMITFIVCGRDYLTIKGQSLSVRRKRLGLSPLQVANNSRLSEREIQDLEAQPSLSIESLIEVEWAQDIAWRLKNHKGDVSKNPMRPPTISLETHRIAPENIIYAKPEWGIAVLKEGRHKGVVYCEHIKGWGGKTTFIPKKVPHQRKRIVGEIVIGMALSEGGDFDSESMGRIASGLENEV